MHWCTYSSCLRCNAIFHVFSIESHVCHMTSRRNSQWRPSIVCGPTHEGSCRGYRMPCQAAQSSALQTSLVARSPWGCSAPCRRMRPRTSVLGTYVCHGHTCTGAHIMLVLVFCVVCRTSLDLIETLLNLSEAGHFDEVHQLFNFPLKHCPDILLFGVLQSKVGR